eukprot:g6989.t1
MGCAGGATRSQAGTVGVAAFLTPCLVLAATLATALRQLGLPVGGLSFTVLLYLALDFLAFRFGRRQPGLTRLRCSFTSTAEAAAIGTGDGGTGADRAAKVAEQAQQAAGGSAPAVARRSGQATGAATASTAKPVAPAAAAAAAASDSGLRLSMLGADIYANADGPFEFENDFFKGSMLFLVKGDPPDPRWAAHFEGPNSNRAFEMQIQGKLKLLPKGEVYMGGELGERPKQGLVTQTVSKIVMSFAKQMVKSLHYSFGERRAPSDPMDAESPHVTFPLYRVMDWFVVTPEAETPPSLGGALAESAEERTARRGGKSPDIVWSTDVTYTMAFHSNIVNFQDWAVTDIPGQGSLDLNTFLCKQPVSVVVYDFTAASASATAHRARDKSYMFRCTISNDSPGLIARPASAAAGVTPAASVGAKNAALSPTTASSTSASGSGVGKDEGVSESDVDDSAAGPARKEAAAPAEARESAVARIFGSPDEPDESMSGPPRLIRFDSTGRLSQAAAAGVATATQRPYYSPSTPSPDEKEVTGKGLVKSGAVLPLLMGGAVGEATRPQNISHDFLGEGNGGRVAMRKGTAMPAGVQVVKVGGSSGTFRSDYLYEGDVIVLHHPESRKFVRIGRGWALGWSSKASASKIHFVVKGIDPGRPLAHGQEFCLRSRRWSDWEVGVARQASSKVGGRGLGCFNKGKRRNTTRLSLLTLAAKPWFDADKEGVIPALEAEENAITISVRGPFEDVGSGGDEDEDEEEEDGSDAARSEADDGMSDSDHAEYDSDVEVDRIDRGIKSQSSISGDGISVKAGRAMLDYSDSPSSLHVGVPAWVEFLHRGRRQGQLAFLLAVHAVPPATAPASTSMSSPSTSAASTKPSTAAAAAAAAAATAAAATDNSPATNDSAGTATTPSKAAAASGPTAATSNPAAGNGDGSPMPPPGRAKPPSWTCLRTGRELSGVVQAYRENVGASVAEGSWRPKPRPRVMKHMGTADQSVRLLSYEVSEMQRWEASIREGSVHHGNKQSPPSGATGAASPTPNADGDAPQPEGRDTTLSAVKPGDGVASPPPQLRSPRPDAAAPRSVSDNPHTAGRNSSSPQQGGAIDDGSQQTRRSASDPSTSAATVAPAAGVAPAAVEGGRGGMTPPYRMLCELLTSPRELDRHFLSGSNASDLGVTVGPSSSPPILGSTVARCLWESHWREEWAVLFPSHVACYMPLSKKAAWVLPLRTLHKASTVSDERCPLPGLRCIRLETVGRAHHLCFSSRTARDNWLGEISRLSRGRVVDPPSGLELSQDPRESYVLKTTKWRMPPRLVLNARRPGFDLPEGVHHQQQQQPWELSAQLLRSAFKVPADPGNKRLVTFLDLACTFREVDLGSLDLESDEAFCFFANLYHLIVRHMLLVLGPPSAAKEWPAIYEQVSYEVGGDVFSLQELEHCVLRGRLPRPILKDLPKRFAPLPPEGDDHYAYSLGKADARVSLFLNNGSQSNPTAVVLLSPETLDEQLNRACQAFVDHTVKTDSKRRQILVHKVFQLYARDLQPAATSKDMVRYSLRFAGNAVIHGLSALDVDISQAHIRYHPYLLKCHETMLGGQRVASSDLSSLQEDPSRVRNVCILAHVDHGKTTLSDGLVCSNGIISSKLAGKLRYLDSTEDEQKRGITMHSSAISLLYKAPKRPTPEVSVVREKAAANASGGAGGEQMSGGGAREAEVSKDSFLINLIDSPGHIDFSSDVSTATRLCDCGLVVVDVLEGVCAQTHAVFRQARAEQMRPLLVLNKVDRLASELQLTPLEAWQHLHRLVENVNALTATLVSADECAELDEAADTNAERGTGVAAREAASSEAALEEWTFSPEHGNVVFCSALDGWGFGLGDFARLWAKRVGCKPRELRRMLWGSFVLNAKTKKVTKWTPTTQAPPMFVSMILDPIWQLYDAAVRDKNGAKAGRMAGKLGLEIPPRELASSDPRAVLQSVMKRWLPLSEAVLRMVVERGPSPTEAQTSRVKVLWPPAEETSGLRQGEAGLIGEGSEDGSEENARIRAEMDRVRRAVAACDASPSAPVVIFVSKMIPVKKRDITDTDGKLWRPPAGPSEEEENDGGGGEDDRDSLTFVAFARVLSGTVTPDTPLLILGPKYHPLKTGAWTHASPLGDDWISPDPGYADPTAAAAAAAATAPVGEKTPASSKRHFTRRSRGDDTAAASGETGDGASGETGTGAIGGGGGGRSREKASGNVALFMMMGAALQPVARVPAGNVLALAGLEGRVNKCATLSDTPECPAMRAVTLQAKPMVRVAVEALHQQDMDKLELGLSRLYQADPAVEVSVTTRGEHVVCCLGELHLEQSLKDLRERYACVELKASLPLVAFRETVVAPGQVVAEDGSILAPPHLKIAPWADEEGLSLTDYKTGRARVVTPDKRAALTLRCLPLPLEVARLIEAHPNEVRVLSDELGAARVSRAGGGSQPTVPEAQGEATLTNASNTRSSSFLQALLQALREASLDVIGGGGGGAAWSENEGQGFLSRTLAFGPRNVGTNVLARCAGRVEVNVAGAGDSIEEAPSTSDFATADGAENPAKANVSDTLAEGTALEAVREARQASVEEASKALRVIENSVVTGFQLATLAGPLAGEELHGLCFLLEKVEITEDCLGGAGMGNGNVSAVPPPPPLSSVVEAGDGRVASDVVDRDGGGGDGEKGSVLEVDSARGPNVGDDGSSVGNGSVQSGVTGSNTGERREPPQQHHQRRRYGPLTGQIISIVRMGCRASMLCCPVRLVEAFYRCSLQCDQLQLGNMYAVLSKRRGRVVDEDLVDGTQLFLLTALLPVAESFGFADELLKKTSGAGTTPQLAFSHWEVMELDPFWRPQTSEEREDEGEEGHLSVTNIARQYLDAVRKRKGLATNDKIVVAAEKQRTLTRNK